MKLVRPVVLSILFLLSAAWAYSDSIPDPVIKTGGSSGSGSSVPFTTVPAGIITPNFTISSASGSSPATSPCVLTQGTIMTTSPACFFENDITQNGVGLAITSLIFDVGGVDPSTVTCGFLANSPFMNCNHVAIGPTEVQVTFNNGSISFHNDFALNFQGFPENSNFGTQAQTNAVPEPGTLALFLGGVGALLARRRSRALA